MARGKVGDTSEGRPAARNASDRITLAELERRARRNVAKATLRRDTLSKKDAKRCATDMALVRRADKYRVDEIVMRCRAGIGM